MTNKARELLERALDFLDDCWNEDLTPENLKMREEIRAYLAEPEVTHSPATEFLGEALSEWFPFKDPEDCDDVYMKLGIFTHGWVEAERHHGIGGGDE